MTKNNFEVELFGKKPKRIESFSDFDVIRIACLNLRKEELRRVIFFFWVGIPLIVGTELLDVGFKKIKVPKTLRFGIELFLKYLIAKGIMELLELLGWRFSNNDLKVFVRMMHRLRDFFGILD